MLICFNLSMPGVASWNGKWTGKGKMFAKIVNLGRSKNIKEKAEEITGYYSYSFGDGWVVGINVKKVDAKEANKIRRKSKGFCGYDWMVDSILRYGVIKAD